MAGRALLLYTGFRLLFRFLFGTCSACGLATDRLADLVETKEVLFVWLIAIEGLGDLADADDVAIQVVEFCY